MAITLHLIEQRAVVHRWIRSCELCTSSHGLLRTDPLINFRATYTRTVGVPLLCALGTRSTDLVLPWADSSDKCCAVCLDREFPERPPRTFLHTQAGPSLFASQKTMLFGCYSVSSTIKRRIKRECCVHIIRGAWVSLVSFSLFRWRVFLDFYLCSGLQMWLEICLC